ncbi:MAG: galactokinase family protein [Caldilineaceae bacterium]
MYTPANTPQSALPDVASFIDLLNQLGQHPLPAVRTLFDPAADILVTRAPGRMDLMGGIADYSGSLVLQLPIREATLAAIQLTAERTLTIVSLGADRQDESAVFRIALDALTANGQPLTYEAAHQLFQRDPVRAWAAYVAGAFLVLMRERGAEFAQGARLLLRSDVPEGKGVSSSAAVEVAAMSAIAAAYNLAIAPRELAILCQMVENRVVGAPCGVMDQMSSACGEENRLLALLCQPAEIQTPVAIPPELAVWGIDSGIRHAVSGSDYTSVRVGAFMGYRVLLDLAGVAPASTPADAIADTQWGGYLANAAPSEFAQRFAPRLVEQMEGAQFLKQYGATTDSVTKVDAGRVYAVRQPTAHPIHEHFRVRTFGRLLQGDSLANAELLGECMYQSHASYSACGLGSDGTDQLVQLARAAGPAKGIYGAKITGGGSGGTVAILARRDAAETVLSIAQEYANMSGRSPYIFAGSSPGAAAFGCIRLKAS